jgi:protein translocase SecG subunit
LENARESSSYTEIYKIPLLICIPSPFIVVLDHMRIIANVLPYIQIILSIILIGSILLQQSGAGVGGALGGGDSGGLHHTRRGFEKFLLVTTIVVAILFALSAFAAILIK